MVEVEGFVAKQLIFLGQRSAGLEYHGGTLDRDAQRSTGSDLTVSLDDLLPLVAGNANRQLRPRVGPS